MITPVKLILLFAACCLSVQITAFTTHRPTALHHETESDFVLSNKESIMRLQAASFGNNFNKETNKLVSTRMRRSFLVSISAALSYFSNVDSERDVGSEELKQIPNHFISALNSSKSSGTNANDFEESA